MKSGLIGNVLLGSFFKQEIVVFGSTPKSDDIYQIKYFILTNLDFFVLGLLSHYVIERLIER